MKSPKPERHILSKSTFMYGCQCPKRLWLHKYQPALRDEEDEAQTAIFQSGTNVGLLACRLFADGLDASPATPYQYQQSVADTARFISKGAEVIYEAAFQYEGILAAIDILVKKKGKWYAIEVKGTNSVKPPHIQDASLQYYVITNAGLELEDISIMHLNGDYIREGGYLDLTELFTTESVLEEVQSLQAFIIEKAAELKGILQLKKPPEIEVGPHCDKPYPCDFYRFCSKDLVVDTEPEEEYINKEAIEEFLHQLEYPLQFLDFETWSTAVPEFDGHWPFRPVPFQFSLHIQQKEGGELEHKFYLADHKYSNHLEFAEKLLEAIPKEGSVLVYNKTFENTILNHLKAEFKQLAPAIENIQERLVDLMTPFRKNYRLPAMQGSYSIKYVLPALVPELSYEALNIGNGADASAAFYKLNKTPGDLGYETTRNALLEYCGLDTFAMVKILEKINEEANKMNM